jgi:hypothetical protein
VVSHGNASWIAIGSGAGNTPGSSPTKWQLMADRGGTGATGATGAQGPQGPQGPQGNFSTANVNVRTATMNGSVTTATANCLAGEKAVGGGWNLTTGGNIRVVQDAPTPTTGTPTGWTATFSANVAGSVYAICVS